MLEVRLVLTSEEQVATESVKSMSWGVGKALFLHLSIGYMSVMDL